MMPSMSLGCAAKAEEVAWTVRYGPTLTFSLPSSRGETLSGLSAKLAAFLPNVSGVCRCTWWQPAHALEPRHSPHACGGHWPVGGRALGVPPCPLQGWAEHSPDSQTAAAALPALLLLSEDLLGSMPPSRRTQVGMRPRLEP